MKNLLLLGIAALVIALPGLAEEEKPQGLVPNGNFESRTKSGEDWPEGWGSWAPDNGKSWLAEDGKHFVRLASQKPGQLQLLYREIKFKKAAFPRVSISLSYRASGVKPGNGATNIAGALFVFRDSEGRILNPGAKPLPLSNTASDWTDTKAEFPVPENAGQLVIMAGLFEIAAGTVDIRSINIDPIPGEITREKIQQPKQPESFITNGDFQTPDKEGDWPEAWGNKIPGITWETEDGGRYMRIVSQKPGEFLVLPRAIPLKPDTKGVELTIRFRTSGVHFGEHEWFDARTLVNFLDADGKSIENHGPSLDMVFTHKLETTPWKEHTQSYKIPPGATQIRLRIGLFQAASGTVDVSKVCIVPMSGEAVGMMSLVSAARTIWKNEEDSEMERRVDEKIARQLAVTNNLIPNGSFTAAAAEARWPDEWGKNAPENLSWENENGKYFIRIVHSPEGKTPMLYKMILLNKEAKELNIKIRYRTSNLVKGEGDHKDAQTSMHFLGGGRFGHLEYGREFTPEPPPIEFSPEAKDWTEVTRHLAVPEGATKLQFMPGLYGVKSGTLDIAEIQVQPINTGKAKSAESVTPAASH